MNQKKIEAGASTQFTPLLCHQKICANTESFAPFAPYIRPGFPPPPAATLNDALGYLHRG